MRVVDHPALVLKCRAPLSRDQKRQTVSAEWTRAALDQMAQVRPSSVYRRAFARWKRLIEAMPDRVTCWESRVEGRLLVGAGGASILESGPALHHTYGVPYVPGTAVKGLASHYSGEILGPQAPAWRAAVPADDEEQSHAGQAHRLVFGTTAESGVIAFLDGWLVPSEESPLTLDVLTPHHVEYYRGKENFWPADWDSPVPVSFLSVRGTFLFAIESAPGREIRELRDRVVEEVLRPAQSHWGLGAKTAAGYGRFR